jgi:hypothetical protein
MTTHTAAYESLSSRAPAGSSIRPDHVWAQRVTGLEDVVASRYLVPYPLVPPSGYDEVPVSSIDCIQFGDQRILTEGWGGEQWVAQDGLMIDNTSEFVIKNESGITSHNSGRIAPQLLIDYDGAAEVDNPATVNAVIQYAYKNSVYQGMHHFCEFEDHPPDSDSDGGVKLQAILNQLNQSGSTYVVGIDGSGNNITVNNCGFAAIAPEGFVYVRPEDLGTGPDQIPPTVFTNTASAFRAHPSVFYPAGKASYVRALTRQAVDTTEITSAGVSVNPNAIGITSVTQAPTESNWIVSVEGQMQIVTLTHPIGSDYRRPRDIWNNVWVPIINGASNVGSATAFGNPTGQVDAVGFRWAYAEYFRCLPLSGTNVVQTAGG